MKTENCVKQKNLSVLTSSSLLPLGNSNKFDCSRLLAAFRFHLSV